MKEEKTSLPKNEKTLSDYEQNQALGLDSGGIDPNMMQDTYNDDLDGFNDGFGGEFKRPINSDIGFDYNCLKSHAKNKLVFYTPVIEEVVVGVPMVDADKKIVYREVTINGEKQSVPIVKKVKKLKIITSYETREEDFPIKDWFNDSIASSILMPREARYVRRIDDMGAKFGRKLAMNPDKVQIMGFLHRLYSQKNSLAETGKGIGGGGLEKIKTQTTKSENTSYDYRKDFEELNEFRERKDKQKNGMFGKGINLGPFGKY